MLSILEYISLFLKSTPIFLVLSLFILFLGISSPQFLPSAFGEFDANQVQSFIFLIIISLLFIFAIPIFINKLIFKENLKSLGLAFPRQKTKTLVLTLIAMLLLIPSFYYLLLHTSLKNYYLLHHPDFYTLTMMITLLPLYYLAEEFFFRGFLFLSLWKRVGWHSFWITDIIFTLSHLSKPGAEILFCIPASIIFNYLTLKTKSIYPALLTHSTLGILSLVVINFNKVY